AKVSDLAQRIRITIACRQTGEAIGRSIDEPGAKIFFLQSVEGQELAYRDRDRTVFRRDADQFPLEIGIGSVLRLGDETVNRIVELGGDGDGVGASERRLDQKRGCNMADV